MILTINILDISRKGYWKVDEAYEDGVLYLVGRMGSAPSGWWANQIKNVPTLGTYFDQKEADISTPEYARTRVVDQYDLSSGNDPSPLDVGRPPFTIYSTNPSKPNYYHSGIFMPGAYVLYYKPEGSNYYLKVSEEVIVAPSAQTIIGQTKDYFIVSYLQAMSREYSGFILSKDIIPFGSPNVDGYHKINNQIYTPDITRAEYITEHFTFPFSEFEEGVDYRAYAKVGNGWYPAAVGDEPAIIAPDPEPPTQFEMFTLIVDHLPLEVPGVVTEPPSGMQFFEGEIVEVKTTQPPTGWTFLGWRGDDSEIGGMNLSFDVIMTKNKNIRAIYDKIKYPVTISVIGDGYTNLSGTVYVEHGEDLIVAATPNNYSYFEEWSTSLETDIVNGEIIALKNITTSRSITAVFSKDTGDLILKTNSDCAGTVRVKNLANSTEVVVGPLELKTGKVLSYAYGTPLELFAEGVDLSSQFLKYIDGIEFKKRLEIGGSYQIVPSTDDDPYQYLESFIPEPTTNIKTIEVAFFCKPEEKPRPRWSYTIECPVPTLPEGVDSNYLPTPSEEIQPEIASVEYLLDRFKIIWTTPVEPILGSTYPQAIIIQYSSGDGNWISANTIQTSEELKELNFAEIVMSEASLSFRVIVFGGIGNGISEVWNYVAS